MQLVRLLAVDLHPELAGSSLPLLSPPFLVVAFVVAAVPAVAAVADVAETATLPQLANVVVLLEPGLLHPKPVAVAVVAFVAAVGAAAVVADAAVGAVTAGVAKLSRRQSVGLVRQQARQRWCGSTRALELRRHPCWSLR